MLQSPRRGATYYGCNDEGCRATVRATAAAVFVLVAATQGVFAVVVKPARARNEREHHEDEVHDHKGNSQHRRDLDAYVSCTSKTSQERFFRKEINPEKKSIRSRRRCTCLDRSKNRYTLVDL